MKIDIHQAIYSIVEAMLPRFTSNKLLFISIRCNYDFCEDKIRIEYPSFTANFIFHRPSNYTKVLFQKLNKIFVQPFELDNMELKSDHDSCWRNDGVESTLSKIHFQYCDALKVMIAKKRRSKKYADSLHREIYRSYPSFASLEKVQLLDGVVIRKHHDERNFTLTHKENFYEFHSIKEKADETL